MKIALAVLALSAGCMYFGPADDSSATYHDPTRPDTPPPDARVVVVDAAVDPAMDATPPSMSLAGTCTAGCAGATVCSIQSACVPASSVRDVSVRWTYYNGGVDLGECSAAGVQQIGFSLESDRQPSLGLVACGTGAVVLENVPRTIEAVYTYNPRHTYGYCSYYAVRHVISANDTLQFDLRFVDAYDFCGY